MDLLLLKMLQQGTMKTSKSFYLVEILNRFCYTMKLHYNLVKVFVWMWLLGKSAL